MKIIVVLFMLMIAMPVCAGTFRNDFSNGNLDGWILVTGNMPIVENGELVFSNVGDICHIVMGEKSWSDYTVQADIMLIKLVGAVIPQVGLGVRTKLPEKWGWYEFLIAFQGSWKIVVNHVFENGAESMQAMLDFNMDMNRWYNFKMILRKEHIEAYLDDKLIKEFDDNTEISGRADLIVWGIETHIDNLVVTGPDIPDGGSSFSVDSRYSLASTWGDIKRF